MKNVDIRRRMLLATLLPVILVALVLSAVFQFSRVGDVQEAHYQRGRSLAHQLAMASEYGLFSGNIPHLQTLANGALHEPNVLSVVITDNNGQMLVRAGSTSPALTGLVSDQWDAATHADWLTQPIMASQLKLDELFEFSHQPEPAAGLAASEPGLLGHVMLGYSRNALVQRQREILLLGLLVTVGGLLLGSVLALRLGRGVILPIVRVSNMVQRIGRGELSARAEVLVQDPLRDLQIGLNQMAENLEAGRDELEQRIAIATQESREKKEEAETATLAKTRFLAAASHDLRQPTHAIGLFVARLAQLPHDAETLHLIGNLEASVRAMEDLLDGLLDISRLDAHVVQVQVQPFALADILASLQDVLSLSALEKGLRLRVRPTNVWLMSDPLLLHRILLNLLSNALRYTIKGSVLVACRRTGGGESVRIEVWDSGIGIAPEHYEAIFREFYQVGNAARNRNQGLGLGLNIVDRTAQLLGYRLQMHSRLGLGTRFSIEVPLLAADEAHEPRNLLRVESLDNLTGLAGLPVLVVEDDALARDALVSLLESWGCQVGAAAGLSDALWHLKKGLRPRVIVSDYRLNEGETGIDTIRQLRLALGSATPACLISGDADPPLLQAAREATLTLLHKPVRPAKLRSLLRRLAMDDQAKDIGLV